MLPEFSTIIALLDYRASAASGSRERPAYTFLGDGQTVADAVTYAELQTRAKALAAHLQSLTAPGDRVLLAHQPGLDYIVGFFACVYAGVVAVPAVPPSNARTLPRLELIVRDAQPRAVLALASGIERLLRMIPDADSALSALQLVATDNLPDTAPAWTPPPVTRDSLLFLQYTSGSTGSPKGVMVSHGNLLANLALHHASFWLGADDVFVSWLPPYHDFGLMCAICYPLYAGSHAVHLPPAVFMRRPYRWLKVISDYRARMTGGPNFAYQLCSELISDDEKRTLDLSSLEVAANGSERIRAETLTHFAEAFACCGFRAEALAGGYGLAESALLVTTHRRGPGATMPRLLAVRQSALAAHRVERAESADDRVVLVSNGWVQDERHDLLVVDPHSGVPVGPGEVGEIWFRGPSVAAGYWRKPEATAETFGAIASTGEGGYLRTGDYGFVDGGELFPSGRRKEVMIFGGRNFYPQDIEVTLERLDPAFRSNGAAAFALEPVDAAAQLAVIIEVESRTEARVDDLPARVRAALLEQHELFDLGAIVLVKAGRIPRTSSGKIERLRCAQLYRDDALEPLWQWRRDSDGGGTRAAASAAERRVAAVAETALGRGVLADQDLFAAGLTSLLALDLLARLNADFGANLSPQALFAAPTVAGIAAQMAALSVEASTITEDEDEGESDDDLPLSAAQQQIWLASRLGDDAAAAFHLVGAFELRGALDVAALARAADALVARHEGLRTAFVERDDTVVQRVLAPMPGVLRIDDLAACDAGARDAAVARALATEAATAFGLADGKTLRLRLLCVSERHHVLCVALHHLVGDAWSAGLLFAELSALYDAAASRPVSPLPPAGSYRRWLRRERAAVADAPSDLEFWKKQLQGIPVALDLPADRRRPALQRFDAASVGIVLDDALGASLRRFAQQQQATVFMVLFAAWAAQLARLSGQDDIVVGVPFADRHAPDAANVFGLLTHTQALRLRVDAASTVGQLVQQARDVVLGALAHPHAAFSDIVEALNPPRSLAHGPLFQVMLVLDNTPLPKRPSLHGLDVAALPLAPPGTAYDLVLALHDDGTRLGGRLEYATALFDAAAMTRHVRQFVGWLEQFVAAPQRALAGLTLVDAAARQALLTLGRGDGGVPDAPLSVSVLFEQAARRYADRVAIRDDDACMDYARLDRRANAIAARLRAAGVQPNDRVAVHAPRGVALVSAVLGILKAGAAYLPLAPELPPARHDAMIADSTPTLLFGTGAADGLDALAQRHGLRLLRDDAAECVDAPDLPAPSPDAFAYVIYTSGSTGAAKGVVNTQAGLANRLLWWCERIAGERPVVAFKTSIGFVDSVTEMLQTLLCGGELVVFDDAHARDSERFSERLVRCGVTHLVLVPSLLRSLLDVGPAALAQLCCVVCSGESLPWSLAQRFMQQCSEVKLYNFYGSSEANGDSTFHEFDAAIACAPQQSIIGRPIANTQIHLLDGEGGPVPRGAVGEIHIGGAGVAWGYWNREALTAQRFVRDPFAVEPARLYRTGDLARWREDGALEFLGRNDFQVKLRGYRIEPGEVEARLSALDGVAQAVVVVHEERLVAYWTPAGAVVPSASQLRASLSEVLPDYLVPSAYVVLPGLPLTPNGKLDRRALPAPDATAVVRRGYEAPQGDLERQLAGIWSELLNLGRVGRQEHFFEVGGHSLLAVRLVSRVRQRLGVELALRTVFAQPVLSGMAAALREAAASALPPIARVERGGRLALSWSQQRLWFLDRLDSAASAAYHMAAGLELDGELDRGALQRALDGLVARHEVWRTRLVDGESGPYQAIDAADRGFALVEEDLRHLSGAAQVQAVDAISRREAQAPFDLACGPLVRGRLLRLSAQSHRLLVTQHHAISDGWSIGVIVRELAASYAAFVRGETDPLPELPIQYADYAQWQRDWLQGEVLATQLDYWRGALRGAPALLELPTDRSRPLQRSHAGAALPVELSRELSARVRAFAQRQGVTVFMVLLSAWSVLLSRLSGQRDVVIGTPVANRRHPDTEGLIGFFVNTLALRVRLDETLDVAGLLEQIRSTTLEGYAHQDVPFEQVVEALNPPRTLSHSPVFQAMLGLNNTPGRQELALEGLSVRVAALDRTTAQFDLSLLLDDDGEVLAGQLEYATALFDAVRLDGWLAHWQVLLDALTRDATASVDRLAWLTAAQRHEVVETFNATAVTYPDQPFVHGLFEAQAARTPDAVAVWFDDEVTTYAALDRQANRIAHRLIALGVQPDDRVAIAATRGPALVAGLLGILKSGAAYVPLDPQYPVERLAYMVEDCAPVALLVTPDVSVSFVGHALPTLVLDAALLEEGDASKPSVPALRRNHLAYVIYTSGSTGRPKGVMNEHAAVVNRLQWAQQRYGLEASDRVLQKTPFGFDVSVWEFFWTLGTGATLVVARPQGHQDPDYLQALVEQTGVTTLHFVPSMLPAFLDAATHAPRALRRVLCSGEALPLTLCRRVLAQWPEVELHNLYGPTEAAVDVTAWAVDPGQHPDRVPIGAPIANTRIYLLDANGAPVPLGVAGEIHIGGIAVARGYLGNAALTAERFIADPFVAGGRLYKTGDLGRWLADGTIEYLGRNDFQVKLRGLRIELGEIEARLQAIETIREAVVIARQDDGDTRLVAYLVAEGDAPSVSALRAQLSTQLPEYMVPSAFVVLDALPLTPNGKLDRAALPAPGQDAVTQRGYVAPQDEREALLASLWQELLGRERVGRHDQFFELGGHSLQVVTLIQRLRANGWDAQVRNVFATPVLADLAAALQPLASMTVPPNMIEPGTMRITPAMLPLVSLSQAAIDTAVAGIEGGAAAVQDIYPLAPLQEGILFHHLLGSQGEGDTYVLRTQLAFDTQARLTAFVAALQQVVDRHDILRTSLVWDGVPQPLQIVRRTAQLSIAPVTPPADGDALAHLQTLTDPRRVSLRLDQAPLLRGWTMAQPQGTGWWLVLLHHHLVLDHVALELAIAEVGRVLRGEALPAALPFRQFIAPLRGRVQEAESYFRARLGDIDAPTAPFGVLDVQADGRGIIERQQRIAPALAQRLRVAARCYGVSAAAVWHLAWAQVLGVCTDRRDVVFGTVLSGRGDAEPVLGMFINTLPLRITRTGTVAEAVQQAQRGLAELLRYEQTPLALAQRCSGVVAPLPLFTTLYNYRHSHERTDLALPGVTVLSGEERTNYPVTLSVDDLGEGFALTAQCVVGIDAERVLGYLQTAVSALVAALESDDTRAIEHVAVLPESERRLLLETFNATAVAYPEHSLIHREFEAQAARTPDAIALSTAQERWSYAALDAAANRLAHRLCADYAIAPDTRIALVGERSAALVIAQLAVLKAGAAYVPLDPQQPAERLRAQLLDCGAVAVFVDAAAGRALSAVALPQIALTTQVCGDWPAQALDRRDLTSRHLAYVMYTSGSTGRPKGVMVEHRSVLRLSVNNTFAPLSNEDCVAHCANPAFDASTWEIWPALLAGARVHVIDAQTVLDPPRLSAALREGGVTALWLTVGLFNEYVDALSEAFGRLRYLLVGGDALDPRTVARVLGRPQRPGRLINGYGPTETTTFACTHAIETVEADAVRIPIGRPIANTRVYILDAQGEPVPVGVAGELCIGGPGVARGYLNQPELTAQCFVADAQVDEAGARLYRSGDRARYRADGVIEFLGRDDGQVKLRGFRVETGEIETQLVACEGVRQAHVLVREDTPGDRRLVAYVVGDEAAELDVSALQRQLAARMPAYMLPHAVVLLDAVPLTPNGKLDRAALPAPAAPATPASAAPVGDNEHALAAIWRALVGAQRIARDDDFFQVGGNSLLALRLLPRVREQFGVAIGVADVFRYPTLRQLAEFLVERQMEQLGSETLAALQSEIDALTQDELLALLNESATHDR